MMIMHKSLDFEGIHEGDKACYWECGDEVGVEVIGITPEERGQGARRQSGVKLTLKILDKKRSRMNWPDIGATMEVWRADDCPAYYGGWSIEKG